MSLQLTTSETRGSNSLWLNLTSGRRPWFGRDGLEKNFRRFAPNFFFSEFVFLVLSLTLARPVLDVRTFGRPDVRTSGARSKVLGTDISLPIACFARAGMFCQNRLLLNTSGGTCARGVSHFPIGRFPREAFQLVVTTGNKPPRLRFHRIELFLS